MTFEEAQTAASAWVSLDPGRARRWASADTKSQQRVFVKETEAAPWLEFWPNKDPSLEVAR